MAYQAKLSGSVSEDLELVNEFGEVAKTIHVHLDADSLTGNISEQYVKLLNLQKRIPELQQMSPEQLPQVHEEIGNAVITLFQSVFGAEGTQVLLDFYDNHYQEMIREVMPFITNVVLPQVRKLAVQGRKNQMNRYRRRKMKFGRNS